MALLDCLGVPYVVAPMEAEAQCAALELAGLCDGVVTDDSDAFVFGAKKVYKNIFDEKKFVEAYYAADVQRELKIARPEFVALALLLGGDYCPGVKGVGIVNGMEIVSAFRDDDGSCLPLLERFRAWHDGTEVAIDEEDQAHVIGRKEFTEKHRRARLRWELPPNFPSTEAVEAYTKCVEPRTSFAFKWGEPDVAALHAFCSSRHLAWTDGELDAALRPMLEKRAAAAGQPQQRRLDQYYEAYHSNVRVAHVRRRSRRGSAQSRVAPPLF
ncbi:XPG I-region-domain-containing protein [Pelagophyceae sp. CCMP2097]|nr:XPG I-region-domain-containing protein [Pelagophyceae sp. CCMP2097]